MEPRQPNQFKNCNQFQLDQQLGKEPKCRICWNNQGQLIVPCQCTGLFAYVHRNCMSMQIRESKIMAIARTQMPYNFRCQLCRTFITFQVAQLEFNPRQILQFVTNFDEESAINFTLNSICLAITTFMIIIMLINSLKWNQFQQGNYSIFTIFLLTLFLIIQFFVVKKFAKQMPKMRKPHLVDL